MLSKPALLLLGMIEESPKGPYEIIKKLDQMNVRGWLKLSDATVYSTFHSLEKKAYIKGKKEKNGNMPERTVYSITKEGEDARRSCIRQAFTKMDYDTTAFYVAASYMNFLTEKERKGLLYARLLTLKETKNQIEKMISSSADESDNVQRMEDIVEAEIISAKRMLLRLE